MKKLTLSQNQKAVLFFTVLIIVIVTIHLLTPSLYK